MAIDTQGTLVWDRVPPLTSGTMVWDSGTLVWDQFIPTPDLLPADVLMVKADRGRDLQVKADRARNLMVKRGGRR